MTNNGQDHDEQSYYDDEANWWWALIYFGLSALCFIAAKTLGNMFKTTRDRMGK